MDVMCLSLSSLVQAIQRWLLRSLSFFCSASMIVSMFMHTHTHEHTLFPTKSHRKHLQQPLELYFAQKPLYTLADTVLFVLFAKIYKYFLTFTTHTHLYSKISTTTNKKNRNECQDREIYSLERSKARTNRFKKRCSLFCTFSMQ